MRLPILGINIPNMGNQTSHEVLWSPSATADALFPSVQQRVLALLFGQPDRRFLGAELIDLVGAGTGATHRVTKRLAEAGLILEEAEGRQKHYRANPESPVFEELVGLIRKTVGLVDPIREALKPLEARVLAAFVYGSVAAGEERASSDVDLMVVAEELDYPTLFEALVSVERQLGRTVNANLLTPADWRRKEARAGGFAESVAENSRLFVIGTADDLS